MSVFSESITDDSLIEPLPKPVQQKEEHQEDVIPTTRKNKNLPTPLSLADFRVPYEVWSRVFFQKFFTNSVNGNNDLCSVLQSCTKSECVFIKRDHYYSVKKDIVKMKFYCKHMNCRSYGITVYDASSKSNVVINLYTSINPVDHKTFERRNVTGDEKVALQNELRIRKPLAQEMEDAKAITLANIHNKNLGPVCTKYVYRNNRKEALAANDRDPDFFISLEKLQQELLKTQPDQAFIQYLSKMPFEMMMVSQTQLDAVIKFAKNDPLKVCVDFTENVICDIQEKKVLLLRFATTVPTINSTTRETLVLLDGLTRDRTQTAVKVIGSRYKALLLKRQKDLRTSIKWPLFQSLSVDKDFSLIYGLCESFNNISYQQYLCRLYEITWMKDGETAKKLAELLTPILLCYNHYMHTVSEHLKSAFQKNSSFYTFLLGVMRVIGSSINYHHLLLVIWYNVSIVLTTEKENDEVNRAVKELDALVEESESYYENNDHLQFFGSDEYSIKITPVGCLSVLSLEDRFYKQSPFYKDFLQVSELAKVNAARDLTASEKENPYYSPDFFSYFMKFQAPFIPSVAPYIHNIRGCKKIKRTSNAVVEGSFGATKTRIKEDINLHEKDRPDRVFSPENERKYVEGVMKIIDYGKVGKLKKKKIKKENEEEEIKKTPTELELSQTKFCKKIRTHPKTQLALKYRSLRSQKKRINLLPNLLVADYRFYQDVEEYEYYYVAHNGKYFLYNSDFQTIAKTGKEIMNSVIEYVIDTTLKISKNGDSFQFYTYAECMHIFETGFVKS